MYLCNVFILSRNFLSIISQQLLRKILQFYLFFWCRNFAEMQSFHCTKNEVSIKHFFSKCDQIRSFLRIWSYLLKKSLMENFIFSAVYHKISTSEN